MTVAISGLSESAQAGDLSGWTLSSSATDVFANIGPASPDTTELYLWLWCATDAGGGVSRAKLSFRGGVEFLDFVPSPNVVDTGSLPNEYRVDLTLPGCPFLVGSFSVCPDRADGVFNLCFSSIDPAGDGGVFMCNSPTVGRDIASIGYRGGPGINVCIVGLEFFDPGGFGGCGGIVPVDPTSWGRIKALYFAD